MYQGSFRFRRFHQDERGATFIEYVTGIAVLAACLFLGSAVLSNASLESYQTVANEVGGGTIGTSDAHGAGAGSPPLSEEPPPAN